MKIVICRSSIKIQLVNKRLYKMPMSNKKTKFKRSTRFEQFYLTRTHKPLVKYVISGRYSCRIRAWNLSVKIQVLITQTRLLSNMHPIIFFNDFITHKLTGLLCAVCIFMGADTASLNNREIQIIVENLNT